MENKKVSFKESREYQYSLKVELQNLNRAQLRIEERKKEITILLENLEKEN